jgi:hypothetical protein
MLSGWRATQHVFHKVRQGLRQYLAFKWIAGSNDHYLLLWRQQIQLFACLTLGFGCRVVKFQKVE